MRITIALLLLTGLLSFAREAGAQTYNITWYKIAGGGGTSTNGSWSISGTIGQPDAGTMAGGGYTLNGGFWGMIGVVQTPGAPKLTILAGPSHHVILSWPTTPTAYRPQQAANVSSPTSWGSVNTNTYPITSTNGSNFVTLPITGGSNQFFRLINP